MSQKILGIDLGTGSIGISLRNPDIQGSITDQLEYFSADVFKNGGVETSYAADRRKSRLTRRLYDTRRRRLWETLKLLIEYKLCPLTYESLESWMKYDKTRGGFSHQYPVEDIAFERWIRLDIDGDGNPDYTTPYHLRKELAQNDKQISLDCQEDRYKLGRALYHIAQRRGFKSSKGCGEMNENEILDDNDLDSIEELKTSELKKNRKLTEYMLEHNCATVACAFADLIDNGIRIRASEYQAVRTDYKQEIKKIFEIQNDLSIDSDLYKRIISEKKGEGTIFYKKPLASQKGNVGKCTLEPKKRRCPISHPVFEEFRALSFINNIRYKSDPTLEWTDLTQEILKEIYEKLFIGRVKKTFKFEEVRKYLEKRLNLSLSKESGTINYSDSVSIEGCPVTARLINLFGENWSEISFEGKKQRQNQAKEGKVFHNVKHTAESIWNYCLIADEPEDIERFCIDCLGFDSGQTQKMIKLWGDMQQGYAMLSQKAMKNINRFLRLGLRYSDAVLLAKIPELLLEKGKDINDNDIKTIIDEFINNIKNKNLREKTYTKISNALIAGYKALDDSEIFAYKDYDYLLDNKDIEQIKEKCIDHFGNNIWNCMSDKEKDVILKEVANRYQDFFWDQNRDYIKVPKISDEIYTYLCQTYALSEDCKTKLYHPSMISVYTPKVSGSNTDLRLGSPNLGGIKNPVALRTLNILRQKINQMLDKHLIDPDDTRIVIETTRRKGDILDDANMRKAISQYQTERQNEREEIRKILTPKNRTSEEDIDKALYVIEQHEVENWQEFYLNKNNKKKNNTFDTTYNKYVGKYKLWLEQGCCCIYTGKVINLNNLFDDNCSDIEHTIPRSLSFDNSDSNLTVCDSYYNRHIKKNRIPTQLENYDKEVCIDGISYSPIKPRLRKWEERVKHLEDMVNFWKHKSTKASTKDIKDFCIVNKHKWQMELDYWRNKLDRFTRTDIPEGFRNSQLVDTGIITRHAIAYLKSIFNNVVAEKGSVTADFRKILGIQSIEEKKDRSKHSHHAIDATVLTLVPVAALREEMLKLYYQKEECIKLNQLQEADYYERQLREKIKQLRIGKGISCVNDFIERNILINHRYNDRALQNAKRKMRKGGKVVRVKTEYGYKDRICDGESFRLEISTASSYGAIVLPDKDKDGNYIKRNGKFEYSKNANEQYQYTMVQRVDIKTFEKEEQLDIIIDPIVKQSIKTTIKNYATANIKKSLKSIIADGVWIRKDKGLGDEIKFDKKNKPLAPIRHVRCKVKTGQGFLKYDTAIHLRKQKYESTKSLFNLENRNHKQYSYTLSTGNYICLMYEGILKGNVHREFVFLSNYDITKLKREYESGRTERINTFEQFKSIIMNEPYFTKRVFKTRNSIIECNLTAIIRKGDRVLKWNESPEELYELDKVELLKRLYVVKNFNKTSSNHIYIKNVLLSDAYKPEEPTSSNFKCLIEHRDFEIILTDQGDNIVFND